MPLPGIYELLRNFPIAIQKAIASKSNPQKKSVEISLKRVEFA